MASGDFFAQERAARCLARLGPAAAPAIPDLIEVMDQGTFYWDGLPGQGGSAAPGDAAAEALVGIGAAAVEPVARAVQTHKSFGVRSRGARVLGRLNDARGLDALLAALGSSDRDTHVAAHGALAAMTAPAAGDRLLEIVRAGRATVRSRAMDVLVERKDARVAPLLRQQAKSANADLRAQAIMRLLGVGVPDGIDVAMAAAVGDRDAYVRMLLAGALGRHGDPKAVPALIRLLGDESTLTRIEAADSLAWLGDAQALEALRARLAIEKESSVRDSLTRAIERLEKK